MPIDKALNEFAQRFNRRIPEQDLKFSLEYIGFGETPLAFETLCDYLCEYDTEITAEEHKIITDLNGKLKQPLDKCILNHLKKLSKNND